LSAEALNLPPTRLSISRGRPEILLAANYAKTVPRISNDDRTELRHAERS
jgi:hypothetical protein